MLKINDLSKFYGKKEVVKHLSLKINRGEIFGFLGPNGAGKTTTIKMISNLVRPTQGEILINDISIKDSFSKYINYIGAVLEGNRNIYWRLTPLENIIYFAGLKGIPVKEAKKRSLIFLDMLDLIDKKNIEVRKLSRGMQQKVAIACMLVHNPSLLLMDEPTIALDVETTNKMKETIKYLAREEDKTIFLTSHNMNIIEDLCDRVAIIKDGEIVACDEIEKLKNMSHYISYKIKCKYKLTVKQEEELSSINSVDFQWSDGILNVNINNTMDNTIYKVFNILGKNNNPIIAIENDQPDFEEVFLKIIGRK